MLRAIIQARLTSKRLPNKILKKIGGKTVLQHVIDAVNKSKVDLTVVATPKQRIPFKNAEWFIGSEENVLSRYYQCALMYKADTIVRVTADSPLLPPEFINDAIDYYNKVTVPYIRFALIDGWDVEVFSFRMLEEAHTLFPGDYEKEHVTPFMEKKTKISIDTPEEFKKVKGIYDRMEKSQKQYPWW